MNGPVRPRLRDLGIVVGRLPPGEHNAITDVPEVRVGHTTLVRGDGPLRIGQGPVRTGVTAIHPHAGSAFRERVPAAIEVLNGAGEITGRSQVDEFGLVESPIVLTNTLAVGVAHTALVHWLVQHEPSIGPRDFVVPVVAETSDGFLNDIAGGHVTAGDVVGALDAARAGPVAEGNVGGGTGMMLFGFKGGIGTASRLVELEGQTYTVGVLVQGNFGSRPDLLVDGAPVGREITDLQPVVGAGPSIATRPEGSVIVVIATDAPLLERQLARLCRRGMLGLGRVGSIAGHTSGDLLLAFSNAQANRLDRSDVGALQARVQVNDRLLNPFFLATVEGTAEAVLNALVAAETLVGRDGNTAYALPHDRLMEIMGRYGRVAG